MTSSSTTAPPQEAVGPLIRGLAVLRSLSSGDQQRAGDLARATGLARSTVDRILATLENTGHVRLDGHEAVLAPRAMEFGNAYLTSCRLPDLLGPLANRLADAIDESVSISVPDLDGVRFVHQAPRRRAMSLTFRIGDLLPAERGAPGALFAADWTEREWDAWRRRTADPNDAGFRSVPVDDGTAAASFPDRVTEARAAEFAVDNQLIEPALIAVAAPLYAPDGTTAAAISVVSHTSRHTADSLAATALPVLRDTVVRMRDMLAVPPPPVEPESVERPEGNPVQSLARGLAVLTALGGSPGGLTLTAVAQATGLPRATARRSLMTLEYLGYALADGRLFRPTPRVLGLGYAALSQRTLSQIAEPHLATLVGQVHESASMSVLANTDIRYIARVPTVRIMSVNITVGTRFPAYAASMGRVLLAGLPTEERAALLHRTKPVALTNRTITSQRQLLGILAQVEHQGHALVEDELEEGLRSIAVPVRDLTGHVVAAINVSSHTSPEPSAQALARLLPPLRATAAAIESDVRIVGRHQAVTTP
ncbi:IclR family transcriptional regulator C-terminal domain-containing protein [Streptomyces sp. NPDC102274]|uniref:IclR family transcriptional regulator domain-containing protein n=1 Tax=Streptomyces sp. NPDC102274 TaxID=3366151 RepID=UPI0037F1A73E